MDGGADGGPANILAYKLRIHAEMGRRAAALRARRLRARYEGARRCLQMLDLEPGVLPPPARADVLARHARILRDVRALGAEDRSGTASAVRDEVARAYAEICRKGVARVFRLAAAAHATRLAVDKKISTVCQREIRRALQKTSKTNPQLKGKRITKELALFYRRTERSHREERRRAEREDYERRKREEESHEAERQARKLHFLITQTELFSHFILGKKRRAGDDAYGEGELEIAEAAAKKQRAQLAEFDAAAGDARAAARGAAARAGEDDQTVYNNSVLPISQDVRVPAILRCELKGYQKRGLEWLVSLYDQGINGMLADEMGLGKTVQAISFLAHLAEAEGIWGPFLVVTPASTLPNWEQEFARFLPAFRVVAYWGSVAERRALRRSWQQRKLHRRDSPFHVVLTSYQLAVADEKYFARLRWQYMVLDEAQAIKSSASARWRALLGFKARSRLLLTGTPIQNTLHELWALLHFIMPILFDSHGEFSEWFRIEGGEDGSEAARLRMVLQPFMLRREKKDVAHELGEKVEKTIFCELSPKQRRLYEGIRARTPVAALLDKLPLEEVEGVEGLMNVVMQFRKVCNHPDLFERREAAAGWAMPAAEAYFPALVADHFVRGRGAPPISLAARDGDAWKRLLLAAARGAGRFAAVRRALRVPARLPGGARLAELKRAVLPRCFLRERRVRSMGFALPAVRAGELRVCAESPWEVERALARCVRLRFPAARHEFVALPSMERFVSDSGKLAVLDELLPALRADGHRVLIYFQMTRMIDLFEDYLAERKYSYLRLDGRSKIASRKDIVRDWQASGDKFIFLLSTRAGGLGINLTAADTVVFYDSDWNPTADQQAMDRAHRLGQTKQVTVYRLVTRDTIEERVMERAGIKGEMQRRVIQTGSRAARGRRGASEDASDQDS